MLAILLVALASAADVLLTLMVLRMGGRELNPLVNALGPLRWVTVNIAVIPLLIYMRSLYEARGAAEFFDTWITYAAAFRGGAALANLFTLMRLRREAPRNND
jgi:hypothetical protein